MDREINIEIDAKDFKERLGIQDGYTPIKGVDFVDGIDGKDGKDGKNGKDGAKGTKGDKGEKGKDGKNGKDGKDGKDGKKGIDGKDGSDGSDGSPDTPIQIRNKLEKLSGKERLSANAIKDLPEQMAMMSKRGGGGGGTWGSITGTLSDQTDLQSSLIVYAIALG